MKVVFSRLAEKQLKKLPRIVQFQIAQKIRELASGGELSNTKLLVKYKNTFRIRVGNYRMVYRNFSDKHYLILIEHRKSVYQSLKRIW